MDTKLIELRLAVRALPTTSRMVQLSVKAEVLRLTEDLMHKQGAAERYNKHLWNKNGFIQPLS